MIRKASKDDMKELQKVYDEARERMYESGNTVQWEPEYPQEYIILKDIERGFLHVMEEDGEIVAAFSILTGKEPNYDTIFEGSWPEGDYEYVTIHRVAGKKKAHHVLKQALDTASKICPVIRIDTHEMNKKMQSLIAKYGFTYYGKIIIEDGSQRLSFQQDLRK